MKCLICGHDGEAIFRGKILNKYDVQYYQCRTCGLLYTDPPYWLDEAYVDSIACSDTGIMNRNIEYTLITNIIVRKLFSRQDSFLDYGGGYGVFVRMMRDLGYDWYWFDKFTDNLFARGFEFDNQKIEMITAFELFEHFSDPLSELDYLFSISDTILFSTQLYDDKLCFQPLNSWWYYAVETGQHIVFYSQITLEYLASKYKKKYYKINNGLHLITGKTLDCKKIDKIVNSRYSWIEQVLSYKLSRKNGLTNRDNKVMIEKIKERIQDS